MATVRQVVPMAGERYVRNAGDVYETDEAEAQRLAAAGIVEIADPAGEAVVSYATRSKAELAALAAERGLSTDGTKAQIIARLEAADGTDDASAAEPAEAAEPATSEGTGEPDAGEGPGGDSDQPAA
jgi:hypothetical protein